jgi:hypothetical protein
MEYGSIYVTYWAQTLLHVWWIQNVLGKKQTVAVRLEPACACQNIQYSTHSQTVYIMLCLLT